MSKISIKKDFKNGEKLYDTQLNNNFKVIEAGVNANESSLEETIEKAETRLQKELTDITADRGWDWNGGDRVTFFKGNDEQVTSQPIKNGQLLYNTNTGETALDDAGKRVVTGSGNVVEINNGSTPSNLATKLWVDRNKIVKTKASQVTTSMDGNDLNMAPAVKTVKDYVKNYINGVTLYEGEETTIGNPITLSDDVNNYDDIEIITEKGYYITSIRVPVSYGKAGVMHGFVTNNTFAQVSVRNFTFNGNKLNTNNSGGINLGQTSNTIYTDVEIRVKKVIGYKREV